ncbi:hypothetical protein JCM1841_000253 [Sporobolomyces salmonicolor]
MGLLDKIPGLSSLTDRASSAIRKSESFSAGGIEGKADGTIHSGPAGMGGGGMRSVNGPPRWYNDDDGTSPLSIGLRILQTFFPFVNLCIYIALAAFQSKWNVGVSFLVGLSLFFNLEALLHGGLILAAILLSDKVRLLRGLERAMRQVRMAVIINTFQSVCMLLMAIVTTVSANVAGCKATASDPHADVDGYTDHLGGFCRDKRAGAAFWWLTFFTWLGTLILTAVGFVRVRRHPISTGFVPPGSQFPQDDEEAFARPSYEPASNPFNLPTAESGYRPSHDYAEGGERLYEEYGAVGYETYGRGQVTDPFEDPQNSEEGRYGAVADPYEAVRQSMDNHQQQNY